MILKDKYSCLFIYSLNNGRFVINKVVKQKEINDLKLNPRGFYLIIRIVVMRVPTYILLEKINE